MKSILVKRQRGFTLLEVLVALIVVTVGLVGIAGINAAALKYTKGAEMRSRAAQHAYDLIDRLATNRDQLTSGAYSSLASTGITSAGPAGANCRLLQPLVAAPPGNYATIDFTMLQASINCGLMVGSNIRANIASAGSDGTIAVEVTVRVNETATKGSPSQEFRFQTLL